MYKRTIQETVRALAERNPDFIRAGSLNVSAVARAAKMNQPTLKRILDGDSQNPGVDNEEKICRLFKITVEQLRGKAGIPGIDKGQMSVQEGSSDTFSGGNQPNAESLKALFSKATPRSQEQIDKIQKAASEGKLSEKDIDLLAAIAKRFEDD